MINSDSIYNLASGYQSGFSTINYFVKTKRFRGFETWATTSWSGFKTAIKVNQMSPILFASGSSAKTKIVAGCAVWFATYTFSCISACTPNENTFHGVRTYPAPNKIVRYTPIFLTITRIGLTAVEYTLNSQKAITAAAAMALYFLPDNDACESAVVIRKILPVAAKVTVFILGDPLTKTVMAVELIATALDQ